jgi:putative ABC transport system permease protein
VIARALPHVAAAVAGRAWDATVRRGDHVLQRVEVRGVEPGYMDVDDLPVARGRPVGEVDQRTRALACVIGAEVADQLFGTLDPLGREIRIAGLQCVVVGIGERKGSSFGASRDLYVLVPLPVFERLWGRGSVTISVRSAGQDQFVQAQDETRALLRQRRHVPPGAPDDFELVTPDMYMALWRNLSGAIFVVILGVSVISLVVGGIVIMNIMLVSVTERTREIGIRKALGARRRDILGQFLVEATTLSSCGGLVGLVLGVLAALLIGLATPLPIFVSPVAIVLGVAVSLFVGITFGAWPAARAARQDPIEALRYE